MRTRILGPISTKHKSQQHLQYLKYKYKYISPLLYRSSSSLLHPPSDGYMKDHTSRRPDGGGTLGIIEQDRAPSMGFRSQSIGVDRTRRRRGCAVISCIRCQVLDHDRHLSQEDIALHPMGLGFSL